MASTRNKNTIGDYNLEQKSFQSSEQYALYKNSQYGAAYNTRWCGNGLLPAQIPWTNLSHNSCDIESFLMGIGSTNLTKPRPAPFKPELKSFGSANIYETKEMNSNNYIPEPLIIVKGQRPFPI